jgi:hypothetical protein
MTQQRSISFHHRSDPEFANPLWVITDTMVPAEDDTITIENADGSTESYTVVTRDWVMAKQGASSFTQVRVIVDKITAPFLMTR